MPSTLQVDQLKSANGVTTYLNSGTLSNLTFPAGHVIQVKHFIFTGTQDTTTSFAPIQFDGTSSSTGYGCDITLSSASNKVLIFGTISMGYQDGAYNSRASAEYSTDGGSTYSNLDVMHNDFWAFWEHAQGDASQEYNVYVRSFSELIATGSITNHFRMQVRKNSDSANSIVNKAYITTNITDNTTIQLLEVVG